MSVNSITILKLCIIAVIVIAMIIFGFLSPADGVRVPPLVTEHQFQDCPFKLDLPGKTSSGTRDNRETAEFLDDQLMISAGCSIYYPEDVASNAPDDLAKDFLARRMGLRIYKSYKVVPLHIQSSTAQIRYEAQTEIRKNIRTAYGVIHVSDNYILDIEVLERAGPILKQDLDPLFGGVEYSILD